MGISSGNRMDIFFIITSLLWMLTASGSLKGEQPARTEAHHHHSDASDSKRPQIEQSTGLVIPDLELQDQEGQKVRFYSDLVKNKVVVINFIFTTCTTICPPLAATFSRIQSLTGGRSGTNFHLISISVDPVTDTPERLKAWAGKFNRKPGWTLVTGEKLNIDKLLRALGTGVTRKEEHSPLVLIGSDARGTWTRVNGISPAPRLISIIEGMIAAEPSNLAKESRNR